MSREIILPIFRSTRLCVTACGVMHSPRCCRPKAGNFGNICWYFNAPTFDVTIKGFNIRQQHVGRPGSSVGIATELRAGWSGDRTPLGGERWDFPPVQTGPPSLPYNGYRVFPGGKIRLGRAAVHSPLLAPRSWKSTAIPLPTLWATTGPVTGLYYFTFRNTGSYARTFGHN